MSYKIIQHYNASPNNGETRSISGSEPLSSKATIAFSGTKSRLTWLSGVLLVILIGTLAFSGCTSKDSEKRSNVHGKQTQQEKGSAASKSVHKEVGEASWYGPGFQGQETANGETFNQKEMTAAHPSLPMGTKATVTNLENDKKVVVRINDRGPYAEDRVIDLSSAAAKKLDMKVDGTAHVKIETKPIRKKR
ncbi:MAG: septal ring lytic transglycosylase RlpA family protein [Methylosarcina sp.]